MLTDFKTYIRFDICLRQDENGALVSDIDRAAMNYIIARIQWLQIELIKVIYSGLNEAHIAFIFEANPNSILPKRQAYYVLLALHEALFYPVYSSRLAGAERGKVGELNIVQADPLIDYSIRVTRLTQLPNRYIEHAYRATPSFTSDAHLDPILTSDCICTGAAFWLDTYNSYPMFKSSGNSHNNFTDDELKELNEINSLARYDSIKRSDNTDKSLLRHAENLTEFAKLMRRNLKMNLGGE